MSDLLLLIAPEAPPADLLVVLEDDGIRVLHRTVVDPAVMVAEPLLAILINYPLTETISLCSDIRQINRHISLLAVTPNNSEARLAVLQAGADDVLTSPLDWIECRLRLPHRTRHISSEASAWGGVADSLLHDLKSPLATIISSLELLRELTHEDTTYPGYLVDNSLLAARRQNFLIEDLLDYMLLQSGSIPLTLAPTSVQEVMDILLGKITDPVKVKEMVFTHEVPANLPPVQADKDLLVRVLNALIDTTLKFCTRHSTLKIQASSDEIGVMIRLMDNGRAILPEYDDDIFDLPQQWQARREGSRTSVAMSLPFARAALRAMGGDVVAFSNEEWTTFTVQLQVAN